VGAMSELHQRLYEALDNVAKLHPEDLDILSYIAGINYIKREDRDDTK